MKNMLSLNAIILYVARDMGVKNIYFNFFSGNYIKYASIETEIKN